MSRVGRESVNKQFFRKDHQDDQVEKEVDLQAAEVDSPEQADRATGAQGVSSAQSPGQVWQEQCGARTAAAALTGANVTDPVLRDVA